MKRNPSIELYRVMLMFGICLLHTVPHGRPSTPWAANILLSCVVGFVFISGWFGIKFSWWKLVKLYGVGAYATLVLFAGLCLRDGFSWSCAVNAGNQFVHGFWFLHAYAFMMMLAPSVNAVIEKGGKTALIAISPLLVMVWCWGFGLTLPIFSRILPRTAGLDAYGGITLLGIYAAARICRMLALETRFKVKWSLLSLPFLWFATGVGLGDYNSPFAFALAGTIFLLVCRVHLNERMGAFVSALAPSMFSVYLLHTNAVGGAFLQFVANSLEHFGMPLWMMVMSTAVIVFMTAVLVDVPRRVVLKLVRMIPHG